MKAARTILWVALGGYPFLIRGIHAAAGLANPLAVRAAGLLLVVAACLPVAMALFCLRELPRLSVAESVRRAVGREAVLGAVSAALFVALDSALNPAGLAGWRDEVWWLLLAAVFALRFVPAREFRLFSDVRTHKVHIASGLVLLSFAALHIANHLAALWSFAASDAMMNALRRGYRIAAVERVLLAAVVVQTASGVRLLSGSRLLSRSTFLRNVQILSGAYLGVFLLAHVTGVVVVNRVLHGGNPLLSAVTGTGEFGMMTSQNNARLMPYYALAVAATFVHVAAAGRWLLVPALGSRGAARFCVLTMWLGVAAALVVVLPMMQVHLA